MKKLITSINNKKILAKNKVEKSQNKDGVNKNNSHCDNFNIKNNKLQSLMKNFNQNGNVNNGYINFNNLDEKSKIFEKEPKVVFNNPIMSILNLKNAQNNKETKDSAGNPPQNTKNLNIDSYQQLTNPYQNLTQNSTSNLNNLSFPNHFIQNNMKTLNINDRQFIFNNINSINEAIFQRNLQDFFNTYLKNYSSNPNNAPSIDLQNKLLNYLKEKKIQEYNMGPYKQLQEKNEKSNFSSSWNIFQDKQSCILDLKV